MNDGTSISCRHGAGYAENVFGINVRWRNRLHELSFEAAMNENVDTVGGFANG